MDTYNEKQMQTLTNRHEISKKNHAERNTRAEKMSGKKNIFGEDSGIENSFAQKRMTPIT